MQGTWAGRLKARYRSWKPTHMHSRFDSCPAYVTINLMTLLKSTYKISQMLSQPLPSYLQLKSLQFSFFDDSFPLETRLPSDFTYLSNSISTLLNDVLSVFVFVGEELLAILVCIGLVFLFSKMYSKQSSNIIVSKLLETVKRLLLLNGLYLITYNAIRIGLFYLPSYYQTKHWLTPSVRNYFVNDSQVFYTFTISFFILFVFAALHTFINSLKSFNEFSPEVPILTFLVACFSWSLLEISNFGLFIVCLEGFSLTLYILATVGRTYGGISAAVKYFVFGTLGSVFLYWGGLGIFELSSTMQLDTIKELTKLYCNNSELNANYFNLIWAQNFILLGFLIKLGAAPLHQWVADVYAGVPLFVTAFYSTFVKLVLFILFLQFATNFVSSKEIEYAALTSLIIGCFGTLRQVEIKRFLAYSSITHTGYLLMGDLTSVYVYLVTYVIASILFFSVVLNIKLNSKEILYLSDLRFIGQSRSQLDRIVLTVTLASMAGLPPFAGFYGKMTVWMSLIEDIYLFNDTWSYILFIANILTSLIAMFYYAQVMCILFVNNESVKKTVVTSNQVCSNKTIIIFKTLGVIILTFWTFIMPYLFTILQTTL